MAERSRRRRGPLPFPAAAQTLPGDGVVPARRRAGAASDSLLESQRGPVTSSSGRAHEQPPVALRWRGPNVLQAAAAHLQAAGRASPLSCGHGNGEPRSLLRRISRRARSCGLLCSMENTEHVIFSSRFPVKN